MNYHAFTPMTDTREEPSFHRGIPVEEQLTVEVAWWEPKPAPTVTRYVRPSRRSFVRRLLTGSAK